MPTNHALQRRREAAMPRGLAAVAPVHAARGINAELWDAEGRRFIDFTGGAGALNVGHRHPRVMAAVQAQLDELMHAGAHTAAPECVVALAERLNELMPGDFAKRTAFFTTGAEAVENAVKIARAHTRRPGLIALNGGYHGRTFMAMALTGKVNPYKKGFGPFPGPVYHVPAPSELNNVSVQDMLGAIDALFRNDIEPEQVAAILIEPVQGEGGCHAMPADAMLALRRLCDQHGIVLIADEIQTGFGRTGRLFAMEHHEVAADLTTLAKSLGGGLPISAVTGRAEIMEAPVPGSLGGTYAGNPMAAAAAHAVLDVIRDEKLCERADRLGARLQARLKRVRPTQRKIAEIRGMGSMIAVEFLHPTTYAPDPAFAREVQQRAQADGLLLATCGVHGNVIRFLYPLTIEDKLFDEALAILSKALEPATQKVAVPA